MQTLYYVTWAGKEGYKYQKVALEAVAERLRVGLVRTGGLHVVPARVVGGPERVRGVYSPN